MTGLIAPLYEELITSGQNILIAGMTGSGKSVILNGLINSILYEDNADHQMVLVDLKMVEFNKYKHTTHCMDCATTPDEAVQVLNGLRNIIQERLEEMEERGLVNWDGTKIHLLVDEAAELMLEGKEASVLLQRICQIGRAAGVQVVMATQCPLASVIPTKIKVNFPIIIGLHTATAQHSRNILERSGCERLPLFGEALILRPMTGVKREKIPMIPEEWLTKIIELRSTKST